jgi:hypothetical protein
MTKVKFSAVVIALFLAACGGSPSTQPQEPVVPQEGEGVVQLPLTTQGSQGEMYRLTGATFAITGAKAVTLSDDSHAPSVSAALPAGNYTIQLNTGWTLERMGPTVETVQATLVSPNPMPFTIQEGQTRSVRFLFKVPGNGNAEVGFSVDTGGWMSGTFDFAPLDGPSTGNPFEALAGTSVPFVMSFESSNVSTSGGFNTRMTIINPSPISVQFGGTYSELMHERLAPAFQGATFPISLVAQDGSMYVSGFIIQSRQGELFTLEVLASAPFTGVLDAQGYPEARPFQFEAPFDLVKGDMVSPPVMGTLRATVHPR